MLPIYLEGMYGLGDNFYQYPIVQEMAQRTEVYLRTPWPQLYPAPVHCVNPHTSLRTQKRNAEQNGEMFFTDPLPPCRQFRLTYVPFQKRGVPMYQGLLRSVPLEDRRKYFLKFRDTAAARGNYAVIRPATIRTEWGAASRNPKPEYIQFCVDHLRERNIETIVIADVDPPDEIYDGIRPAGATRYYERGEKSLPELIDLIHGARMVIGGVGFIAPMCIALGTPALIIHGGAGGYNGPMLIDAPGEGKLTHVLPEHYCQCQDRNHNCNKTINREKLKTAMENL